MKMNLTGIGCEDVNYTPLTQNMAPVNMATKLWIPYLWGSTQPVEWYELHKKGLGFR
jgi:hypothetical protein